MATKVEVKKKNEASVNEKAFPIDLKPNALTFATIRKSMNGEDVHRAKDANDLFRQLGI